MADDLKLKASFDDKASAGVRKLGKTLAEVKPSHGMAAAQKWMETFHKGADRTVGALRPVSGMLNSVGVGGLAASLSIGEMVKQFRELADSTLTMKELGRQSRMSATEIARLQYAAGKLHVDPSAMSGAIGSWSSKMVEFRMHTSQFYRDLMRQNSDVAAKIESDSPVDGLKRALDFISRIKDPQIQKRWADDAGLGDLVPMLGKGPDGLAAAFADAGREVKPITQEMQDAADRFNEATNRFNQTWANFKNDLGPSILDPLSHTLDKLDDGMKWAAKYPGDAAAAAATIAGSAAALYARYRLMRALSGGGGSMGRAAGELAGAATKQGSAGTGLLEAAAALKEAALELRGKGSSGGGGGGGGGAPAEPGKPEGTSPGYTSLLGRGLLAAYQLYGLVEGMPEQLEKAKTDNAAMDPQVSREAGWGDAIRHFFQGRGTPEGFHAPSAYDREARARGRGLTYEAPNTDGNALHRNDEMPAALTAQEVFAKVRDGSKEGIVAGLREMAQQQELEGKGGDGGPGGTLGAAARVLGKAGISAGARSRAGAGFTEATGGGTTHAKGNLAANQKEAYAAALKEGLSPTAARALTANMSGESLANPNNYHWDRKHMSGGIVQWDPERAAEIKAKFGDVPWKLSVADQTRAAIWEYRTHPRFAATKKAMEGDNGPAMIGALVDNYEGPYDKAKAKAERMGYYRGFNPDGTPKASAGAGTPAPSSAAQTAAEAFKAHQKALNGTPPQAHAAGGHIQGPGTGTSDSIPALLSNGEYVVRASAAGQFLPLLHAINGGSLSAFASGGPVGFGVAKRFYPTSSAGISDAEGRGNRVSWRDFFRRPAKDGGMGASWATTLGALAMMQGESGRGLNTRLYNYDVNGPSGGVDQLHDVTEGKFAGRLHRLSDAMTGAMLQHVDWQDRTFQQANFRKESTGSMWWAWRKMLAAKTAAGALRAGVKISRTRPITKASSADACRTSCAWRARRRPMVRDGAPRSTLLRSTSGTIRTPAGRS